MALKKILRDKFRNGFKVNQESYPFKTQCPKKNELKNIIIKGNTEEKLYNSNLMFLNEYTTNNYASMPVYYLNNGREVSIQTEEMINSIMNLKKGDMITISYHIEVEDTSKWVSGVTGRVAWAKSDGKFFYALGSAGNLEEGSNSKDVEFTFLLPFDMNKFSNFYIYGCSGKAKTTFSNFKVQKTHLSLPNDKSCYADVNHPVKLISCGENGEFSAGVRVGDSYLNTANGVLLLGGVETQNEVDGEYVIPIVLRGRNLFPINSLIGGLSKNLIRDDNYINSLSNAMYERKKNIYTISPIDNTKNGTCLLTPRIKIKKDTTITVSFNINRNGEKNIDFQALDFSSSNVVGVLSRTDTIETVETRYSWNYTATKDIEIYFLLKLGVGEDNISHPCIIGNLQIEYGNSTTEYEMANALKYNGSVITPKVFKDITGLKDGDYICVSYNCQNYENDVQPQYNTNGEMFFDTNTQYKLNTIFEKPIKLIDGQSTVGRKRIQQITKLPDMINNEELNCLHFSGIERENANYKNIQIEVLGEYETPTHGFEEYREPIMLGDLKIKEPLRGIKKNSIYHNVEAFDYIDFNEGKLYRKLKEVKLNGDSGWVEIFYDTNRSNYYYFKCPVSDKIKANGAICCNMSRKGGNYEFSMNDTSANSSISDLITTYYSSNDENCIYFQVEKSKVDTDMNSSGLDKFKEILNKQPMVVIYETAIIKEESIKTFKVKLPRGGSTIMADTKTSPYSIEGSYISSDKK